MTPFEVGNYHPELVHLLRHTSVVTERCLTSSRVEPVVAFFVLPYLLCAVGWIIHLLADRKPNRRTAQRAVELLLLWVLVFFGAWSIYGGIAHLSGLSGQLATEIGYAPSMFQWEVGWGDITVGVLGVGCGWRALRDNWMTAAVVAVAISYWGDAIGHVMELVAHDNTAPDSVWAIPGDIVQPLIAVILLIVYRVGERTTRRLSTQHSAADRGQGSVSGA